MASGKSLELAALRRAPVPLTSLKDDGVFIGSDHTYSSAELERRRRQVARNDARRTARVAKRWGR